MDVLAILVSLITDPPPPAVDRAVTAWEQLMLPPAQEDDPWWDCRVDGNRICGPSNVQGVPAGMYAGGVLVTDWQPEWFGQ